MKTNVENVGRKSRAIRTGLNVSSAKNGCLKISKSEYEHLGAIKGKVSWFCPPCKTDFKNLKRASAELRKENQELKQMIESMTDRLDNIEKRLHSGSHDTNMPTRNDPEHLEELIYENIKEHNEREKKKCNLVIFGIEESHSSEAKDRQDYDRSFCTQLFSEVIKPEDKTNIVTIVRIGKPQRENVNRSSTDANRTNQRNGNPNPRPLLIKFENDGMKWDVLSKAKILKNVTEGK